MSEKAQKSIKEFLMEGDLEKLIIIFYNYLSVQNLEFIKAIFKIILKQHQESAKKILNEIFDPNRLKELSLPTHSRSIAAIVNYLYQELHESSLKNELTEDMQRNIRICKSLSNFDLLIREYVKIEDYLGKKKKFNVNLIESIRDVIYYHLVDSNKEYPQNRKVDDSEENINDLKDYFKSHLLETKYLLSLTNQFLIYNDSNHPPSIYLEFMIAFYDTVRESLNEYGNPNRFYEYLEILNFDSKLSEEKQLIQKILETVFSEISTTNSLSSNKLNLNQQENKYDNETPLDSKNLMKRLDQNRIDNSIYANSSELSITILEDQFIKSRKLNEKNQKLPLCFHYKLIKNTYLIPSSNLTFWDELMLFCHANEVHCLEYLIQKASKFIEDDDQQCLLKVMEPLNRLKPLITLIAINYYGEHKIKSIMRTLKLIWKNYHAIQGETPEFIRKLESFCEEFSYDIDLAKWVLKHNSQPQMQLLDYIRLIHQNDLLKFAIMQLDNKKLAKFINLLRHISPKFSNNLKISHSENVHLLLVFHACTIILSSIQYSLKNPGQPIDYTDIETQVIEILSKMVVPQYITVFGEILLDILGSRLHSYLKLDKIMTNKDENFFNKFVLNRFFVRVIINVLKNVCEKLNGYNTHSTLNYLKSFKRFISDFELRDLYQGKCSSNFFIESQILKYSQEDLIMTTHEREDTNDVDNRYKKNYMYIFDDFYMDEIYVDLLSIMKMLVIDRKFKEAIDIASYMDIKIISKYNIHLTQQMFKIFNGEDSDVEKNLKDLKKLIKCPLIADNIKYEMMQLDEYIEDKKVKDVQYMNENNQSVEKNQDIKLTKTIQGKELIIAKYLISIFDIFLQQSNLKIWKPILKSQVQKYLKELPEFGLIPILSKIEKFSQMIEAFSFNTDSNLVENALDEQEEKYAEEDDSTNPSILPKDDKLEKAILTPLISTVNKLIETGNIFQSQIKSDPVFSSVIQNCKNKGVKASMLTGFLEYIERIGDVLKKIIEKNNKMLSDEELQNCKTLTLLIEPKLLLHFLTFQLGEYDEAAYISRFMNLDLMELLINDSQSGSPSQNNLLNKIIVTKRQLILPSISTNINNSIATPSISLKLLAWLANKINSMQEFMLFGSNFPILPLMLLMKKELVPCIIGQSSNYTAKEINETLENKANLDKKTLAHKLNKIIQFIDFLMKSFSLKNSKGATTTDPNQCKILLNFLNITKKEIYELIAIYNTQASLLANSIKKLSIKQDEKEKQTLVMNSLKDPTKIPNLSYYSFMEYNIRNGDISEQRAKFIKIVKNKFYIQEKVWDDQDFKKSHKEEVTTILFKENITAIQFQKTSKMFKEFLKNHTFSLNQSTILDISSFRQNQNIVPNLQTTGSSDSKINFEENETIKKFLPNPSSYIQDRLKKNKPFSPLIFTPKPNSISESNRDVHSGLEKKQNMNKINQEKESFAQGLRVIALSRREQDAQISRIANELISQNKLEEAFTFVIKRDAYSPIVSHIAEKIIEYDPYQWQYIFHLNDKTKVWNSIQHIYGKLKIPQALDLFVYYSHSFLSKDNQAKTTEEIILKKKIHIFSQILTCLPNYDQNVSSLEYRLCHDFSNFYQQTLRVLELSLIKKMINCYKPPNYRLHIFQLYLKHIEKYYTNPNQVPFSKKPIIKIFLTLMKYTPTFRIDSSENSNKKHPFRTKDRYLNLELRLLFLYYQLKTSNKNTTTHHKKLLQSAKGRIRFL